MAAEQVRYIDGSRIRLWNPGGAHLRVEIEGERTILRAAIRRCFPLSEPDRYLSIDEVDGAEVGVVRHLDELEPESRRVAVDALDRRYFTPKIRRLLALRQDAGMWFFDVETQRGRTTFYVRNWRDSAHEVALGRLQINSVDGQRFEIEDFSQLDLKSRRLLEQLG